MSTPPATPILDIAPSWAFTLLRRLGWLVVCAVVGIAGLVAYLGHTFGNFGLWLAAGSLAAALAILFYSRLERDYEAYRLTPSHASWDSGIFRRLRVEAPLDRIQHAVLYRSIRERCFGLGTIGLATAGSDSIEIVWRMIEDPQRTLDTVRTTIASARQTRAADSPMANIVPSPVSNEHLSPPIIGLAGGIGAGKSTVGRVLASLGCLVIDSDQRARAALDRPDVRDQLVAWWGDNILSPNRTVDRSKIAAIVFSDPHERQRLESLVHPIVRQDRAAMIAEAIVSGKPPTAVVVDAPLLFEAGLDKECDAIFFVDVPRHVRLARVLATRGWSEEEFNKREASQLAIEHKQSRSTHRIENSGPADDLEAQLRRALDDVTGRLPQSPAAV